MVQPLLDQAARLLQDQQSVDALNASDRAVASARQAQDLVGEALAQEARARALEALGRKPEAVAAWRAAATAWERAGDGPERLGALASAGLAMAPDQPAEANALFAQALAVGRAESQRPLATAQAWHAAGRALYAQGRLGPAREFWAAALEIREKRAPHSLELAATLNNLGLVAATQGDLKAASGYQQRALALYEEIAPHSLDLADSLNSLGIVAYEQGDMAAAGNCFRRALGLQEQLAPRSRELAMSLHNLGNVSLRQSSLASAEAYYQRALALFEQLAPDSLDVAASLNGLGNTAFARGDLPSAGRYFGRALTLRERLAPGSLAVAESLVNGGLVAEAQGDLTVAGEDYRRGLALYEQLAPHSMAAAESLVDLGNVTFEQGELGAAEAHYRRAQLLFEQLAPHSLIVARNLGNLGNVAYERGDLPAAQRYHRQALALQEKLAPRSLEVAGTVFSLGGVTQKQGDLAEAEEYYLQALSLYEQYAPHSLDLAGTLDNLGSVSSQQWDLAAAQEYYRRALSIRERLAPHSLAVAASLQNLGLLSVRNGDLTAAREYLQRALTLRQELAPRSLQVARTLVGLALLAQRQEDQAAGPYYEQALALFEQLAPDSLDLATCLNNLGNVASRHGELAIAEQYYRRALVITRKLAPDSLDEAGTVHNLGQLAAKRGDRAQAEERARRAWEMVRHQAAAVAGDEARQAFGSSTAYYAAALVRAQVALGRNSAALTTLEEGRAQALQQLLAERQLEASGVPGRLGPDYRAAVAARERAEQRVSQASMTQVLAGRALASSRGETGDTQRADNPSAQTRAQAALAAATQQFTEARSDYTQARVRADQLWAEIVKHARRAFPPPVSVAEAQRALPAHSLFVSFAVGEEETHLFLLLKARGAAPALVVQTIAVTPKRLRSLVLSFRQQVTNPNTDPAVAAAAGRAMFARLFPPKVVPRVLAATRLVISPDGPLWDVPFAALVINTHGPPRYLGTEKAITYAPSLRLFAQSRQGRREEGRAARRQTRKPWAVVVGDPLFVRKPARVAAAGQASPAGRGFRGERRSLSVDGAPPSPLPETRREAREIARLYGGDVLLGERATEAALRRRIQKADVIHLATHGFLNPVRAMSSGVLLAEPAGGEKGTNDDGALQAWEIYSQLKLKAELVVLSACETGRGENVAGEGIVGLTRALQYAGARSIIASQWKVADQSTATLMVTFHQNLRQGLAKDEALRQAMAVVRQDPRTAHPYFWAPFFLTGDPDNHLLGAGLRRQ